MVQPRKTENCPNMTEKTFAWDVKHQHKQTIKQTLLFFQTGQVGCLKVMLDRNRQNKALGTPLLNRLLNMSGSNGQVKPRIKLCVVQVT